MLRTPLLSSALEWQSSSRHKTQMKRQSSSRHKTQILKAQSPKDLISPLEVVRSRSPASFPARWLPYNTEATVRTGETPPAAMRIVNPCVPHTPCLITTPSSLFVPPRYKARRFRLYVNKEPAEPPKIGSAHLRVMSKPPLAAAEFAAAVTFEPGRAPEDTPAAAGTSLFGSSEEKTQAVAALHRTLVKYTPQSVLLALDLARSEVAQEIVAQDAAAKPTAEAAAAAAKAAEEDSAASPEAQGSEQPSTGSVRAAARVAQV